MLPYSNNVQIVLTVDAKMAGNDSNIRLFADHFLRMTADKARSWAASVIFTFPELEVDGEPILTNPLVRYFIKSMYDNVPFLLFFLDPYEPATGLALLSAYARDDQIRVEGEKFKIIPDQTLFNILAVRLADAASYAAAMGEPWEYFINSYPADENSRSTARRLVLERLPELR